MKHLSALDATFLHIETPEMPMHVGGLNLLELPPGYAGDYFEDVKAHIAGRMHLVSVFTKKLALMPFDMANPIWVEDGDIDLDYHIRRIQLPKPGSMRQLEAYVGRLHSSLLDRSRPLWEFYIFDGLASGQPAFYSKIHHAALDGQGAAVMAQAILDATPVPRHVEPPNARTRPPYLPDSTTLVNAALRDTVSQCWRLIKGVPTGLKVLGGLLLPSLLPSFGAGADSGKRGGGTGFAMAPKTLFNVSITNQRVFATLSLPQNAVKEIGQAFGATLNDVVLAICSGALRGFLQAKDDLPDQTLVAAVPVSLRAEGDTQLNNQVSVMLVNLASDVADPVARIKALVQASSKMKSTLKSVKSVLPTDVPSLGLPWLMTGLVSLYSRSKLADRIPPLANLFISNVPGPRMPLYLAGARMATTFPVSIAAHGLALNITVQSYNGSLDFGLIACRRAVPDVQEVTVHMKKEFETLLALAAKGENSVKKPLTDLASAPPLRKVKKVAEKTPSKIVSIKSGSKTESKVGEPAKDRPVKSASRAEGAKRATRIKVGS